MCVVSVVLVGVGRSRRRSDDESRSRSRERRQKKASRTDREQSGNIYIRGVQLTVYVCTVQVMIVKMTIHKGTKRQSHIDIPRDTKEHKHKHKRS